MRDGEEQGKGAGGCRGMPQHLTARFVCGNQGRSRPRHPRGSIAPGDYIIPRSRRWAGLAFSHQRNACPLRRTTHYVSAVITFVAWFPSCRRRFKICPGQPHWVFRRGACSGPERSDGTERTRHVTARKCSLPARRTLAAFAGAGPIARSCSLAAEQDTLHAMKKTVRFGGCSCNQFILKKVVHRRAWK